MSHPSVQVIVVGLVVGAIWFAIETWWARRKASK